MSTEPKNEQCVYIITHSYADRWDYDCGENVDITSIHLSIESAQAKLKRLEKGYKDEGRVRTPLSKTNNEYFHYCESKTNCSDTQYGSYYVDQYEITE